jgi:hypothetical protein
MNTYTLTNPTLLGSFQTEYTAKSASEAAAEFWKLFSGSNFISGNLPFYAFSLQDEKKNLTHFGVKELPKGTSAEYTIDELTINLDDKHKKAFLKGVSNILKSKINDANVGVSGGKHKKKSDDSSSSSSSSSGSSSSDDEDYFKYLRLRHRHKPIYYYWYDPTIYNIDTLFFPTFIAPLSPYVQIYNSGLTIKLTP